MKQEGKDAKINDQEGKLPKCEQYKITREID